MRLDDGAIVANTTLVDKEEEEDSEVALDENGSPVVAEAVAEAEVQEVAEAQNTDTAPAENTNGSEE
jgi:hypothetical protein